MDENVRDSSVVSDALPTRKRFSHRRSGCATCRRRKVNHARLFLSFNLTRVVPGTL